MRQNCTSQKNKGSARHQRETELRNVRSFDESELGHRKCQQSFHHPCCGSFLGWDVGHLESDVIYWDIVVLTTLDVVQKDAYDALIQQRSTINRIPLGVDYLVITDPGKIGE